MIQNDISRHFMKSLKKIIVLQQYFSNFSLMCTEEILCSYYSTTDIR